ncbi:MAG: DUF805 domain-containing protein [Actinomycetota bacterium]|jgi:uncharacterized membrane protein YhaH (DUF805 family)
MSMEEIQVTEYTEPSPTGFVAAIKKGFRGYVVWNARSTRSEYWWWTLFAFIVAIVAAVIDSVVFSTNMMASTGPVSVITALALFLPGLSVWIRRLHDTDRTGWWAWIILIPIAGLIVNLIFVLLPSKVGPTRWNNRIQQ